MGIVDKIKDKIQMAEKLSKTKELAERKFADYVQRTAATSSKVGTMETTENEDRSEVTVVYSEHGPITKKVLPVHSKPLNAPQDLYTAEYEGYIPEIGYVNVRYNIHRRVISNNYDYIVNKEYTGFVRDQSGAIELIDCVEQATYVDDLSKDKYLEHLGKGKVLTYFEEEIQAKEKAQLGQTEPGE